MGAGAGGLDAVLTGEPIKIPRPFIAGYVNVSEQLLRDSTAHIQLDKMIMDELSGRPWTRTVTRRRRTPEERVRQIRVALARRIAPWAMYHPDDD